MDNRLPALENGNKLGLPSQIKTSGFPRTCSFHLNELGALALSHLCILQNLIFAHKPFLQWAYGSPKSNSRLGYQLIQDVKCTHGMFCRSLWAATHRLAFSLGQDDFNPAWFEPMRWDGEKGGELGALTLCWDFRHGRKGQDELNPQHLMRLPQKKHNSISYVVP